MLVLPNFPPLRTLYGRFYGILSFASSVDIKFLSFEMFRVRPHWSTSSRALRTVSVSASANQLDYVSYQGNTFKVKFQRTGLTVLFDPWLVDDLVFAGQDWLYRGKKTASLPPFDEMASADIIVLTQAWDDHCHLPTLKRLPKSTPVVASTQAARVALELGFTNVTR